MLEESLAIIFTDDQRQLISQTLGGAFLRRVRIPDGRAPSRERGRGGGKRLKTWRLNDAYPMAIQIV